MTKLLSTKLNPIYCFFNKMPKDYIVIPDKEFDFSNKDFSVDIDVRTT